MGIKTYLLEISARKNAPEILGDLFRVKIPLKMGSFTIF